jgi:hypothetical protein
MRDDREAEAEAEACLSIYLVYGQEGLPLYVSRDEAKQPIALAWLSPTPAKSISEMPTGESLGPNCGGSGCLASKG